MKNVFAAALSICLLVGVPAELGAKAKTTRITITGGGLTEPIEITNPDIIGNFQVWAGPATTSNENRSLIVDWAEGPVTEPPGTLPRYDVSFYAKLTGPDQLVYVVSYKYDPSSGHGYVYLPGSGEDHYRLNTSSIFHGVEGRWFRAWDEWEKVARPLITSAHTTLPASR
jgi:hypothetical protein